MENLNKIEEIWGNSVFILSNTDQADKQLRLLRDENIYLHQKLDKILHWNQFLGTTAVGLLLGVSYKLGLFF